jgi:hypothetical protein
MPKRLLETDASVVLRDFITELGVHRMLVHDEADIESVRLQPGLFQARNAALLGLAQYVGQLRMYKGALWNFKNGDAISHHYMSEDHLDSLIRARAARSLAMAQIACASCPLAGICGIGPEDLIKEIKQKPDRRRFVARLKRANNSHLCETNTQPGRLAKDVV